MEQYKNIILNQGSSWAGKKYDLQLHSEISTNHYIRSLCVAFHLPFPRYLKSVYQENKNNITIFRLKGEKGKHVKCLIEEYNNYKKWF